MSSGHTLPSAAKTSPIFELPLPPGLLSELAVALGTIQFGSIELVIHDGRVVQLERREKVRVEQSFTP